LDDFLDFGRYVIMPKEDFVEENRDLLVKEVTGGLFVEGVRRDLRVGDGPIKKAPP
jgi:hypothetical protein